MFIYWVINSVVCTFGFGRLGPPYITGIQICKDCAVFVNSHVGQCFTASAFFVYCVCAFVCMVATRWKSVVYLFLPCRSSKALKSRETFCSTVSRNRAALLGYLVLFFLHVHSLVVHACQTRLSVHTRIYFIQRLWKATAPWPSTGPEPRWLPAGRCPPAAGRNQSARASVGPLPQWPAWPPAGRSASTDRRERSTALSLLLPTPRRGTPHTWEAGG